MKKFPIVVCIVIAAIFIGGCKKEEKVEPNNFNESFSAVIDMPKEITKGSEFKIKVKLKNTQNETRMLDTVDVSDTFLKNITIKSSDPAFASTEHVEDLVSFIFNYKMNPGEEKIFEFDAVAENAGTCKGDFDFWTEKEDDFTTCEVEIFIK